MKISLGVIELKNIFKEIQRQPERIFGMVRVEMNQGIGEYLTVLMWAELSHFLVGSPMSEKRARRIIATVPMSGGSR